MTYDTYLLYTVKDSQTYHIISKTHWGLFQGQSQTPILGLNTSPCGQTLGCGTLQEQWQKCGLQGRGSGKRPSKGQFWPMQPFIGCKVMVSNIVGVLASGDVVLVVVSEVLVMSELVVDVF